MKKRTYLASALILMAALSLCACGKGGTSPSTAGSEPERSSAALPEKTKAERTAWTVSDAVLVEGTVPVYLEEGSAEPDYETEFFLRLPEVQGGPLGQEITQELREAFQQEIDFYQDVLSEGKLTEERHYMERCWASVDYTAYQNDEILSLVIDAISYYTVDPIYAVYNIDTETGKLLTSEDLLARKGIDADTWSQCLQKEIAYASDADIAEFFAYSEGAQWDSDFGFGLSEAKVEIYAEYMRLRSQTLSDWTLDYDTPVFLDDSGQLCTLIYYSIPAGSGTASKLVVPETRPAQKELSAQYRNDGGSYALHCGADGITLTVDGKDYPVEGAWKNYIDCKFFNIIGGAQSVPFAVFLCDDGTISFLDVDGCSTVGLYCMTEPLWDCHGVEALSDTMEENADILGTIYNFVYNYGGAMTPKLMGLTASTGYQCASETERHLLDAAEAGLIYSITTLDYQPIARLAGNTYYLGMTPAGMVFRFTCEEESYGITNSAFSLRFCSSFEEPEKAAVFTWLKQPRTEAFRAEELTLNHSFG